MNPLIELARFAFALSVIALPGIALAWRGLDGFAGRARLILGTAIGIALAVYGGYLLSFLNVQFAVWAIFFSSAVAFLVLANRVAKTGVSWSPLKQNAWWVTIVLGAAALRFYPTLCSEYPLGSDPAFHLILARKIALTGQLPTDWTPFERVALNYPLGSHVLVTLSALLADISLHRSFALLLVSLGALTVALVYVIARAVFERDSIALWSAFAYAFAAILGGLDYYRWGGLPNLVGMMFLLAALALVVAGKNRATLIFGALVLASAYLTHHYTMLVVLGVCSAITLALWYARHRAPARRMLIALGGSIALSAFWLIPLALRAVTLKSTGALEFMEYTIWPWDIPNELGIVFAILAAPGIIALIRRWRNERGAWMWTWVAWTGALLLAFALFEYAYRVVAKILTGTAFTAFTPSRFLTDAALPFALAAGWTCDYVSVRLMQFKKIGKAAIAVGVLLIVAAVGVGQARQQCVAAIPPDEIKIFEWIRDNTPTDALILENPVWLEYVAWREGTLTPLPISEPVSDPSVILKRETLGARNWAEIEKWRDATRRAVYLTTREEIRRTGWTRVFGVGAWRVYQLDSATIR